MCFLLWYAVADSSLFTLHAQSQKGIASYYSKRWTGMTTANGERLHHDSLTCAHLTYPFGTYLKVTDLNTGRVVTVRVNDRGPYVRGRIIDLSWGAAKKLGILVQGLARVEVEPVNMIVLTLTDHQQFHIPTVQEMEEHTLEWPIIEGLGQ